MRADFGGETDTITVHLKKPAANPAAPSKLPIWQIARLCPLSAACLGTLSPGKGGEARSHFWVRSSTHFYSVQRSTEGLRPAHSETTAVADLRRTKLLLRPSKSGTSLAANRSFNPEECFSPHLGITQRE